MEEDSGIRASVSGTSPAVGNTDVLIRELAARLVGLAQGAAADGSQDEGPSVNAASVAQEEAHRPPLHIVFAVDTSGSMQIRNRLENVKANLRQILLRSGLSPEDMVSVVGFSHEFHDVLGGLVPLGSLPEAEISRRIGALRADGSTALYRAIQHSIRQLRGAQGEGVEPRMRVVVALTDGEDTASGETDEATERVFQATKAMIASPGVDKFLFVLIAVNIDDRTLSVIETLSETTHSKVILVTTRSARGAGIHNSFRKVMTRLETSGASGGGSDLRVFRLADGPHYRREGQGGTEVNESGPTEGTVEAIPAPVRAPQDPRALALALQRMDDDDGAATPPSPPGNGAGARCYSAPVSRCASEEDMDDGWRQRDLMLDDPGAFRADDDDPFGTPRGRIAPDADDPLYFRMRRGSASPPYSPAYRGGIIPNLSRGGSEDGSVMSTRSRTRSASSTGSIQEDDESAPAQKQLAATPQGGGGSAFHSFMSGVVGLFTRRDSAKSPSSSEDAAEEAYQRTAPALVLRRHAHAGTGAAASGPAASGTVAAPCACGVCGDLGAYAASASCGHVFCREDLARFLEGRLTTGPFPVRCPVCEVEHPSTAAAGEERGLVTRSVLKGLVQEGVISEEVAIRFLRQQMRMLGGAEAEASVDLASHMSKPCPSCGARIAHYKDHGCHHIRPGTGCPACGTHFCFSCLYNSGTQWRGCPRGCSMSCSNTCECKLCPDCRPGQPCSDCTGCPACLSARDIYDV